ncbi:MAG: tRNA-dihydrouridine synthase [Methanosarcina flavescens]|jgi:tRNA-dihydrouridine synthase|uniref:tRNA-dihydrouridine synthase n=1 Tax=Methanosarcina flavescens TaxID=1715806 RepID=UPI000B298B91|nr:tRNA-dihydrouridine synthase [Methanosarcina flavescens]
MKLNKLKIGNTETPGNLLLAPMADVTNLAFRLLCRQNGADLTYTGKRKTLKLHALSKKLELQLLQCTAGGQSRCTPEVRTLH